MVKSIAILREAKIDSKGREVESRVILTPPLISELRAKTSGLQVFIEKDAGQKIDFPDSAYTAVGANICSHEAALAKDIIVGVKETTLIDLPKLKDNIIISYQHFAASLERTTAAAKTNAAFITLETMEDSGKFPCLAPMSEAAAKVIARHADEYALLAKKIITSGMPETGLHGVKAVVLGGGMLGKTVAEEFSERGLEVTLLDHNLERVKELANYFKSHEIRFPKVAVMAVTPESLRRSIKDAFFLVSSMYTAGKKPAKLVTIDLLKTMLPGGCLYPADIDQGGGIEGVFETSLLDPFDLPAIPGTNIFFFAPPNLPSQGARTTSEALGTVVLPYLIEIINKGLDQACEENQTIKTGINIKSGKIIHPGLASVFPFI
ncbi:MAG: hypothetical protein ABIH50_05040 [bacterium]